MKKKSLLSQIVNKAKKFSIVALVKNNIRLSVIFATILSILVLMSIFYNFYQKSQNEKYSALLFEAIAKSKQGQIEEAKIAFKEIADSYFSGSTKLIAKLNYANLLISQNKIDEAKQVYLEISHSRGNKFIKDLAGFLYVKIIAQDEKSISNQQIIKDIEEIENNNKNFKYQIIEQKANLAILQQNLGLAFKSLAEIEGGKDSSQILKDRAKEKLQVISAQGYKINNQESK
ncbi:MAG: tetratricopeptide repeat protein [Rickettsiales bacterium]|jgi:hypothetical protein|nr:tetratricopeptide repeat protein [Rickettsiales bacterium]